MAPFTMLRMVPLPRCAGEDAARGTWLASLAAREDARRNLLATQVFLPIVVAVTAEPRRIAPQKGGV